ncbi:hypothetical protein SLS62_003084 [Diatrype stigma]|uniref:NmrA-like domain-containing protein n=1 Tax=Diatrype stigma TaxID=117547 RepID=A0AAN9YV27_9PEZI
MVKVAIAAATSQLAREIIDRLVETKKHEVIALVRKVIIEPPTPTEYINIDSENTQDPSKYESLPGLTWTQVDYEDKADLVRKFQGVETVLCFFPVHLDPGNATQKRLIDAAIEAGVKRFAPSEWSAGVKLASSLDAIPWYGGKVEVIEYTRFQVGAFMDYFSHPHNTTKYIQTLPFTFDFENQQATVVEGTLDDVVVWTTVNDIANVAVRAIEYEGEWPAVGGISGSRVTNGQMLKLGEAIGRPFTVRWLKKADLEAEKRDSSGMGDFDLHTLTPEQMKDFLDFATRGILLAMSRGVYAVSDEWNRLLPDYQFTQVEDYVKKVWGGKSKSSDEVTT